MDSTEPQFTFGSRSSQLLPPVSAFSAYSLLRNCNYFIGAPSQELHLKSLREVPTSNSRLAASDDIQLFPIIDNEKPSLNLAPKAFFTPLIPYSHSLHLLKTDEAVSRLSALSPTAIESPNFKKHRSEKKPIPEEQKDGKYFERRRRNNLAAKKSRDARKIREDQIALKATLLEHENAILRAQILTLREEAASLRQMVWQRKAFELPPKDAQLCVHTQ